MTNSTKLFLESYAKYLEWEERDEEKIMYKLCEEQIFSPSNTAFPLEAFGFFWGNCKNRETATVECGTLMWKIKEIWNKIAIKNNWEK
jgi:hypothetical protein